MLDINTIIDMYTNQEYSIHAIAKQYNTYPNKIRRLLIKHNIPLKNKSIAQQQAIKHGRSKHPTKGKKRDQQTKIKISESLHKLWQNMTEDERQKRSEQAKAQWDRMSPEEQRQLRESAARAVRAASKHGSKLERFLLDSLEQAGYNVVFHKKGLLAQTDLEIDLFIPELKTAIEIDGPAHFLPIWGYDNLQKHIKADSHKSGLLLAQGFVVLRIKHINKNLTEKHKRDILNGIIRELKRIEKKFPAKTKRYIELEIK